jgi:peptidoglycan/xylan/chitin deacetylase (PgdA/CDA1 family)
MSLSESLPDVSAAKPPLGRRLRCALFGTLRGRVALLVFLTAFAGWGLWYNQHRSLSWRETVNPLYWLARWRGDDLYLPDTAFLKHGNRRLPEVALTFDDGPHIESRPQILDTLKRYHAQATFFDVGAHMAAQPALVHRTLAEGHEIANHSNTHLRLDGLTPHERHREINDADITFFRLTGQHLTLLRPPGERYNDAVLADTRDKGYIVVGHTTASRDYETDVTPQFIIDRTCANVENGSIILLHDYPATSAALPEIMRRLQAQGYRFVTVSTMIAHLPASPRQAALAFQISQK